MSAATSPSTKAWYSVTGNLFLIDLPPIILLSVDLFSKNIATLLRNAGISVVAVFVSRGQIAW